MTRQEVTNSTKKAEEDALARLRLLEGVLKQKQSNLDAMRASEDDVKRQSAERIYATIQETELKRAELSVDIAELKQRKEELENSVDEQVYRAKYDALSQKETEMQRKEQELFATGDLLETKRRELADFDERLRLMQQKLEERAEVLVKKEQEMVNNLNSYIAERERQTQEHLAAMARVVSREKEAVENGIMLSQERSAFQSLKSSYEEHKAKLDRDRLTLQDAYLELEKSRDRLLRKN